MIFSRISYLKKLKFNFIDGFQFLGIETLMVLQTVIHLFALSVLSTLLIFSPFLIIVQNFSICLQAVNVKFASDANIPITYFNVLLSGNFLSQLSWSFLFIVNFDECFIKLSTEAFVVIKNLQSFNIHSV